MVQVFRVVTVWLVKVVKVVSLDDLNYQIIDKS